MINKLHCDRKMRTFTTLFLVLIFGTFTAVPDVTLKSSSPLRDLRRIKQAKKLNNKLMRWPDGPCAYGGCTCFPTHATVQTPNGLKSMNQLQVGELVLVASSADGKFTVGYSKVYAWLQRTFDVQATYLRIQTDSSHQLDLSPTHIVFAKRFPFGAPAKHVKKGDFVWVMSSNTTGAMVLSKVTSVTTMIMTGGHVPATLEGTVIVDGVLASSYALDNQCIGHSFIHSLFAPLRWVHYASDEIWGRDVNERLDMWQPGNTTILWYAKGLKMLNKVVFG